MLFFFFLIGLCFSLIKIGWEEILSQIKNRKKFFQKKNKWIIKIKRSKKGFFLICLLAPLFLSIPIGTIVVAKFYGDRPKAYYFVTTLLIATSFLLTFINDLVFNLF